MQAFLINLDKVPCHQKVGDLDFDGAHIGSLSIKQTNGENACGDFGDHELNKN